jgi:hypothetical protein
MKEFIYHALGICGEHSHPNLLNITLLFLAMYSVYKFYQLKKRTL